MEKLQNNVREARQLLGNQDDIIKGLQPEQPEGK
jgi:hypothetical protein